MFIHQCTSVFTVLCFFRCPVRRKLVGARFGLYGGWSKHSQQNSFMSTVILEKYNFFFVCKCFLWMDAFMCPNVSALSVCIHCCLVVMELEENTLHVPKCCQQYLSSQTTNLEWHFYGGCGLFALHQCCLWWQGEVMNPCFIISHSTAEGLWPLACLQRRWHCLPHIADVKLRLPVQFHWDCLVHPTYSLCIVTSNYL